MNSDEYKAVGLYSHNAEAYNKVKSSFNSGNKVVGIVHATGTGKSFVALQLAYDNKDKKIVYVVPSNGIIEHLKKIIDTNPNLDMNRDFPNLEFRTYQSLLNPLKNNTIDEIECDLLILDEFHHIGAPMWGQAINEFNETHPNANIFGMTAYTVRDRGTSYERDMADSDTNELFSGKIVSRYDLCDAMLDGVLPKPLYKSSYTNLMYMEEKLEERVLKLQPESDKYKTLMYILTDVKKKIHEAPSIPNILKDNLKPNGKYIYFCPPVSEDGSNDIETIKKQAYEWLKNIVPEDKLVVYTSTSDMGVDGKLNREAFYNDQDLEGNNANHKLRIMFAINQYNEGIHAPNIDGVIMGRGTCSDIIYFEQLGRALSVQGNTIEKFDKYSTYSSEELQNICLKQGINFDDNISKYNLIEKIISPLVIDLTNNYEYIKELENTLRDRIKNEQNHYGSFEFTHIMQDAQFDIEIENKDIYDMLKYVLDRLILSWNDYYDLAKTYYENYGNLEIPNKFKTFDGINYDDNGAGLGRWITLQRRMYKENTLPDDKFEMLRNINMIFDLNEENWNKNYELAKKYYEHYGNLEVPFKFKTNDGVNYDENGYALGVWIYAQRTSYKHREKNKITDRQIELLNFIDMRWELKNIRISWDDYYELAKEYYAHYGNLNIPAKFKTNDGIDYDEKGIKLGTWVSKQRSRLKGSAIPPLSDEEIEKLNKIGMIWEFNKIDEWYEMYELAKKYYEHYGNLEVPQRFRTNDGVNRDDNGKTLGSWIYGQREAKKSKNGRVINEEQVRLLDEIGMRWSSDKFDTNWKSIYELAKKYYEHNGNLNVPLSFKTLNGYEFNPDGITLGNWIHNMRHSYNNKGSYSINDERVKLLSDIGMIWYIPNAKDRWTRTYELAKSFYEHYGHLEVPGRFKTSNGYDIDPNGVGLGVWIASMRRAYHGEGDYTINKNKIDLLTNIGMRWEYLKEKNR